MRKRGEGLETPLPHRRRFDLGKLVFQVDETAGDESFAVRFENRFGGSRLWKKFGTDRKKPLFAMRFSPDASMRAVRDEYFTMPMPGEEIV